MKEYTKGKRDGLRTSELIPCVGPRITMQLAQLSLEQAIQGANNDCPWNRDYSRGWVDGYVQQFKDKYLEVNP